MSEIRNHDSRRNAGESNRARKAAFLRQIRRTRASWPAQYLSIWRCARRCVAPFRSERPENAQSRSLSRRHTRTSCSRLRRLPPPSTTKPDTIPASKPSMAGHSSSDHVQDSSAAPAGRQCADELALLRRKKTPKPTRTIRLGPSGQIGTTAPSGIANPE